MYTHGLRLQKVVHYCISWIAAIVFKLKKYMLFFRVLHKLKLHSTFNRGKNATYHFPANLIWLAVPLRTRT